ncbi:protein transport Sec61-like protein [Spraguea lophii 42_110]|uniref:Protein transport Sec61-like protein n=1 Tax=Spraguea lophii (strain 42_110) TaxID=1358809 RepID=S7W7K3_SPRLO|nr:protein transport Sec61-like protein [Spraguea lophii 42_110]
MSQSVKSLKSKSSKYNASSDIFYYFYSSKQFLSNCVKPSSKEYWNLLRSHVIGIGALGFLGYSIKFIHILINNVIVNK